ncbi:hypothetical protein WJX79_001081 [Trebouxia sp. C0005]
MTDPVMVSETGQTYERAAILDWWARGHRTCPATNTSLNSFQLAPNYVLKSLIQQQRPSTSYAPSRPQQPGDSGVVRAALGLVHVLALEVSKAQNSFANPANVDLVRIQLVQYAPVLDAILSMLLAPDTSGEVAAANAATNLAAFRSGVCNECDKSSPSFKQQPSRKRDFFRFGKLLDESDPSSPIAARQPNDVMTTAGNTVDAFPLDNMASKRHPETCPGAKLLNRRIGILLLR